MSFLVAVQSAVFYFLACTPCTKVLHQHNARQQAKKEREIKERIVMEQPHLYRHPEPFNTNPYWSEEIRMGPSLPKKRKANDGLGKSLSQRRLTATSRDGRPSIGTGSTMAITVSEPESTTSPRPSTSPANVPGLESAPTVAPEEVPASPTLSKTASISTSGDWNLKRYQREDEELWGHESSWSGHKLMDAIKQAGTTAGRYMESKLGLEKQVTEEDRYNFYFTPKNPPVNDYHPPVVSSKPLHKDGLRWMLQPPPPAKVMEGKVPVSRSASMMSVASRRTVLSARDGCSLGRIVGERAVEARIRRGETPVEDEGRSTRSLCRTRSRPTAARTRSRRTRRASSPSTDSEGEPEGPSHPRRRMSYWTPDAESQDEDEGEYVSRSAESLSNNSFATHAAQKPRLPTILSSGYDERASSTGAGSSESGRRPRGIKNSMSEPDLTRLNSPPAVARADPKVAIPAN